MPSVQNLEAQLRAKNLWDEQFVMDMTRTKDEQYNTYGLYYGQGLKALWACLDEAVLQPEECLSFEGTGLTDVSSALLGD